MAGQRERRSTVTIGDASELNETARVVSGRLWVDVISGPVGGGSTQYAEDTLHVSGDQVTMAGVVQQAADAALSGDGDRSILQVDETGYLKVNVKTGGTGGTQYAEDSLHVSGDTLTLAGVVQQTADAALSSDGDRSLLQVDETGYLKVNVKTGGSGGVQYTEGNTDASITGTAILWEDSGDTLATVSAATPLPVNTELPAAAALGDADANPTTPRIGADLQAWNGAAWYRVGGSAANGLEVDITRIAAGNNNIGNVDIVTLPDEGQQTMANSISVAIASDQSPIPVTGGGGTQYAEDTPHVSGDLLTMAGVVQKNTDGSLAADGDRSVLQVNPSGWLKVEAKALPVGQTTMAASTPVCIASNQPPLDVNITGGGTSNVQYTEGDSDVDFVGTIALAEESGTDRTYPLLLDDATLRNLKVIATQFGVWDIGTIIQALPAGNNNIGDVDVASIAAGNNNIGDVDIASLPNEGQQTMANSISVAIASDQSAVPVVGSIAHDSPDSGNPVKLGLKAIANGASPTAVTANDRTDWYASRHGIPWVMGGHPNIITREITILASDGAQTNASLLGAIAAGTSVVITMIDVMASGDNSVDVKVRIGFGTASVPAAALAGVNGVVLSHSKIKPGSGVVKGSGSGVIAQGASDEELRITCDSPTGGALTVTVTYHTIEI